MIGNVLKLAKNSSKYKLHNIYYVNQSLSLKTLINEQACNILSYKNTNTHYSIIVLLIYNFLFLNIHYH